MSAIVDLDAPCGRHLTYRDLIECGKTWHTAAAAGTPIDNLPKQEATREALRVLCEAVLDPLADHFGPLALTYGLACPALTRRIPARIAPELDQHASCELNRAGKLICPRRGAAVDLVVPGTTASTVARWIHANTPFDRLYLFGDDLPLHVSHGPDATRTIVSMIRGPSGRLIPRVTRF